MRTGGALLAVALAVGCARAPAPPPDLIIDARRLSESAPCVVAINGAAIAQPDLPAALRPWRGRRVHIRADANIPYRCVGGLIFALQREGFTRIDFIAGWPPRANGANTM